MRRGIVSHNQPALPFLTGEIICPGSKSVPPSRESSFPAPPDPVKIKDKPKIPDTGVRLCDTCRLLGQCKGLELHKNSQVFNALVEARSCPLSAILGIDLPSFPPWRQEMIIQLRLVKEKEEHEANSQFQMGNSGPIDSRIL